MGPWGTAGVLPGAPGERRAWPELAAALDWLPLASLLLAADGGALAVSRQWSALSGLTAEDSRAEGWVGAVDPPDGGVLRARLRDAALDGQPGHADVRLAGRPHVRWSRWWWPGPSGRLIVCVAGLGDSAGPDGQRVTAVIGVAVADGAVPSAGELIDKALAAVRPASRAAAAGPPSARPGIPGPTRPECSRLGP